MGDAVILSAVRTPIADAKKGALARTPIAEIAKASMVEAMKRADVPPSDIDDIVLGEVMHGGGAIGRYVALDWDCPRTRPAWPCSATARPVCRRSRPQPRTSART